LISKNVYETNKLIALYTNPKKHELIDPALYAKFYTKEGFQKIAGGPQKPLKITPVSEDEVKVLSAEHATGYVSRGISYFKKAKLQIGKIMIEADDASLDSKNGVVHAGNAKVHFADGKIKAYQSIIYNINKKTYDFYEFAANKEQTSVISGPGKEGALSFSKDVALSKIEWSASDSVKRIKMFEDLMLSGKAKVALEKYKAEGKVIHVDNANKKMVIYFGSLRDDADLKVEAEIIEVDLMANTYKTKKYIKN
jgi:lipopolysaccharide export system protein LptA